MLVVNLFGGPGTGKSTTAAGVFEKLKQHGKLKVELVTEVAKDLIYEGCPTIDNSLHVLSEQYRRISRLRYQVDIAVTDSPLLLPIIYAHDEFRAAWFEDACWHLFDIDDNFNVMLERVKPYTAYGRVQTEDKARRIDARIRAELADLDVDLAIPADDKAAETIVNKVLDTRSKA